MTPQILTFHVATMASALLMVVFAAGLRRRLAGALPADSLLPGVAAAGLLLVAAAQLLGTGLTTEFVFGVQDVDLMVPETAAFFSHWIGTIPWLWGTRGAHCPGRGRGRASLRCRSAVAGRDQPGPGRARRRCSP